MKKLFIAFLLLPTLSFAQYNKKTPAVSGPASCYCQLYAGSYFPAVDLVNSEYVGLLSSDSVCQSTCKSKYTLNSSNTAKIYSMISSSNACPANIYSVSAKFGSQSVVSVAGGKLSVQECKAINSTQTTVKKAAKRTRPSFLRLRR
ncbi:MAG: hypothetical protein H6621_03180 [Halobacteriovoraceae bacterium]|nr:hypothetical protein [Halobacteriovoraceae bacterium]MCB9094049.1 hypothetical protein [Halobacteriovoraceae bacterium]